MTGANPALDRSATPVGTTVKTSSAAQQVSSTGAMPQSTAGGSATPTATKQSFKRMPHHPNHVTDFNMEKTKFRVFKAIEDKAPPKFRTFFKSGLMDRFLQATLLYFISKFQYQVCTHTSARFLPVSSSWPECMQQCAYDSYMCLSLTLTCPCVYFRIFHVRSLFGGVSIYVCM